MGRKPKLDPKEIAKNLPNVNPNDAKSTLIYKSISKKTFAQYNSRKKLLDAVLSESHTQYCGKEFFFSFLDQISKESHGSTADGYRCAILFFQKADGWRLSPGSSPWADDPDVLTACRGFRYNSKITTVPRGQIDEGKLIQLIAHARSTSRDHFIDAIFVLYGAALRIEQLIRLTPTDVDLPNSSLRVYDKSANAKNKKSFFGKKKILDKSVLDILSRRANARLPDQVLFPKEEWSVPQFRELIKSTAAAYKWETKLKWDGTHTLRHGGVAALLAKCTPDNRKDALMLSERMVSHYSASNEQRILKKHRHES